MDDVTLTFDPVLFQKGLDAINSGITTMNENFNKFSQEASKKTQKVALSSMNLAKAMIPIGIAVAGIRKGLRQIPELGRSFSIAGSIITKQLLWPLRRELIPMLQKMLDWVRDNRAMFLRWGNVVANVFRIIKSIVSGIWKFIKKFWETLAGHLERIFGRTTQTISNMVNVILFKIATIIQFIMLMFEPLAEFFANIFATIIETTKAWLEGFFKGLGDLGPELKLVTSWIKDLAKWISNTDSNTIGLVKSFKIFGIILGALTGTIIRSFVEGIDDLITGIKKISIAVDMFKAWINKEDPAIMRRHQKALDQLDKDLRKRSADRERRTIKGWKSVGEALQEEADKMTKNIDAKEIPGVSSVKKTTNTSKRSTVNNDNRTNNVNIKVDGSKSPEETGNFLEIFMRDLLKDQQFKTGTK